MRFFSRSGFWEAINAPDLDPQCLAGLEFSVFGLGDRGCGPLPQLPGWKSVKKGGRKGAYCTIPGCGSNGACNFY